MDSDDVVDVVIVGTIGAPYGVRGWVHINSFTQPADNLQRYKPWMACADGRWRVHQPAKVKSHGSGLVASFAGVSDRDAAAALTGTQLGVARDALPEPEADEYYWRDLQGLEVFDQTGALLGTVARLMDIGAHVVLVVQGAAGETLIPFVARHVSSVDLAKGRVEVDWYEPE